MSARTAVVAVTAAVLAGGGTAYAAGAPVAGVSVGGAGVTWGALRYVALEAPKGTAVAQIDRATGTVNGFAALRGAWGIPQVAFDGSTAGISAGGQTLVLAQNRQVFYPRHSRFALVNPVKMRVDRIVTLPGAFFFDAIAPDGSRMYLIQLTSPRHVLRYAVRAYDLRHDRLVPGAIVDTTEPDERMTGMPMARATSADGVWAYTLYYKPTGAYFVHALNTQAGIARCIDLPPLRSQNTPRLAVDGGRLDVLDGGHALVAVDRATFGVTRSPEPVAQSAPKPVKPATSQAPARRSPDGAPVWLAVPAGLVLAGLVLLVVRRRRPARGGRSGGAAAGAPSGP
ncbi:MAG TPA: hypothetical protein VFI18_11790 [Gaiellales bacterium]|nr:hypothetical protein [Gaiellales bacterium]